MTVFVVTVGEYSDYSILALFTHEKDAEEFVAQYNRATGGGYSSTAEVESHEAYEALPPIALVYRASWTYYPPEVKKSFYHPPDDEVFIRDPEFVWGEEASKVTRCKPLDSREGRDGVVSFAARGHDREAVVKSVSDRRAKFKAEEAGL